MARLLDEDEPGRSRNGKENNNAAGSQVADSIWNPTSLGLQLLDASDPRVQISKVEGDMDPYEVLAYDRLFFYFCSCRWIPRNK
jgi:hypothetical protein